ncbi:MAG TPA: hypothetical protein VGZ33_00735, partial [Acidimicrobiales bacterium]|nr:hypothetical protein [Acidimicrobiales bacterium]
MTALPVRDAPPTPRLSVAVDVSALRYGSTDDRAFVQFVLAACRRDADVALRTWSARWGRTARDLGLTRGSRIRAALAGLSGAVGKAGS